MCERPHFHKENVLTMNCTCGYSFSKAFFRSLRSGKKASPYKSFALIKNTDYLKVMKLEAKVLEAKPGLSRIKAVAKSGEYVGTAMTCPKCARLTLIMPRTNRRVVYAREK
jgi:hypothetical protein